MTQDDTPENIAQTLARELPKASVVREIAFDGALAESHIAVPKSHTLHVVSHEHLRPGPFKPKLTATFADADSFLAFVNYHAPQHDNSTVWAEFDPGKSVLKFEAVLDEYADTATSWRGLRAEYTPKQSHEWAIWFGGNKQQRDQIPFAEFLEEHGKDVHAADGMPTSNEMLKMATDLTLRGESSPGILLQRDDGTNVLVVGLTEAELRDAAGGFLERCSLVLHAEGAL